MGNEQETEKKNGPTPKTARTGLLGMGKGYVCLKPWPEGCFVQAGGDGIVIGKKGALEEVLTSGDPLKAVVGAAAHPETYQTAFFEAFPRSPDTFIRGEGKTIEDAEADAWSQYQRFSGCRKHLYHRRGYTNGAGFCRRCGMFKSRVFRPLERCRYNCDRPMYSQNKAGRGYCRKHNNRNPERFFDLDRNGKAVRDEHGWPKMLRKAGA